MFRFIVVISCLVACSAFGFAPKTGSSRSASSLKMSERLDFSKQPGASSPLGFWDPAGISRDLTQVEFNKLRESEVKHGRIAMLAVLGCFVGEIGGISFFDGVSGPAIYQYQQADNIIPAFSANVIGLTLAIEGFNIVGPWSEEAGWGPIPAVGVAELKAGHKPGDLNFDPLNLMPKTDKDKVSMKTKEINNGRLAMLAIAGIIAQELVTNQPIFNF